MTKLKALIFRAKSSQRRRQPFSCKAVMPVPMPVWRPWSALQRLAELHYHTHRIVGIWRLLTPICSGRWLRGQSFPDNYAVVEAVGKWVAFAGADLRTQHAGSFVHRWRKCIASGGSYVARWCFVAENVLYPKALLYILYVLLFPCK
jgi:hypothetical protein